MPEKKYRGFAVMSPEKQREIASIGGKAVHASGNGHKWTSETARIAALKGVETRRANGSLHTGHRFNSETASKAGKIGGKAYPPKEDNASML